MKLTDIFVDLKLKGKVRYFDIVKHDKGADVKLYDSKKKQLKVYKNVDGMDLVQHKHIIKFAYKAAQLEK